MSLLLIPPYALHFGSQVAVYGGGSTDVTAPTLSSPTDAASGTTTAALGVATNEGNGTLYWVVSTSATPPSAAQVKGGNDHTGSAAVDSGAQAVSGTGIQSISGGVTGLSAATAYYAHFMHEDAATNQSAVSSADGFVTDFDPSVYGVDAIDNVYAAHAVARLRSSWTGNLVRLRRSSDNAEADFGYVSSTGFLDATAIAAWRDAAGAATAFVASVYDQSGNGRHATQATSTKQPTLDLSGAHPVVLTDGGDVLTPAVTGFARNVGAVSMIFVGKYSSTITAIQVAMSVNNNAAAVRASLLRATSGVIQAGGKRLDADATVLSTGLTSSDAWMVQIGRLYYADSALYNRYDSLTESSTSFQTDGNTSDTESAGSGIFNTTDGGALPVRSGGMMSAAVWVRDLLSDVEDAALASSLAPLKL